MSALADAKIGTRLVTDLGKIECIRRRRFLDDGYRLPLQPAEADAGITEADVDAQFDER